MKNHDNSKKELSKEEKKLKRKEALKKIGLGIAGIITGAGALALAGLAFIAGSSNKEKDIYDFDHDNDDVHYIDWNDDDEEDESDESYGAEDYYSSRLSVDE